VAVVIDLHSRREHDPGVTGLACRRLAAARAQAGMTEQEFAAALKPLIGWLPLPARITTWETRVAAPGDVLVAGDLVASRALAGQSAGDDGGDAAVMGAFRRADLRSGGGTVYPVVVGYLQGSIGSRLVTGGRQVFTSGAALSDMAGWMAHDAGHDDFARRHFERASDLAAVSGDRLVTAQALASRGHLARHAGDPARAIRASRDGLAVLADGPRCAPLEARLHAIGARGFAALGAAAEVTAHLGRAEQALAAADSEPVSPWVSTFDEGTLASEAAQCLHQLGQARPAAAFAGRVVELRPVTRPRSRSLGLFIQASLLLAAAEPEQAADVASGILGITAPLRSHIVTVQFTALAREMQSYHQIPAVAVFLDRLRPVLRERQAQRRDFPASTRPALVGLS
jgi:hypothetical protein